ncbi:hypothetical protein BDR06DRAFT_957674 [Suillus hirtellus]|nr:hypothetical protein BDR06DRAFT_957674 [Suillus hirtellus]
MATSSCKTALNTHVQVIVGENALTKPHLHTNISVTVSDLASQIERRSPIKTGSFGNVYRCVINEDKKEVCDSLFEHLKLVHRISIRLQ